MQRQLEAYNAHDLARFLAEYTDDVRVFRPPATEPMLSGKKAFGEHYAKNRFSLPGLHARLVDRDEMVMTSITIHRIAAGRLVEKWSEKDVMALLIAIGKMKAPGYCRRVSCPDL